MGSSNSKNSAISTKGIKRVRSRGANFFQPSCLGRSIKSSDEYHQNEQLGGSKSISFRDQNNGHSNEDVNNGHRGQVEVPQNNSTSVASLGDQAHRNASEIEFGHTSVSVQPVLSSVNQSNSCFKLIPSSISFKLGRSFSLGSSRGHPASKTHLISDVSGGLHVNRNSDADESDSHLGNSNSACTSNTMFSCHNLSCEVSSQNQNNPSKNALQSGSSEDQSSVRSVESQNSQNDYVSSFRITSRNDTQMRISEGLSRNSIWNQTELGTMETNCPHRRVGSLEPMEGTVRFSRTLSVGRLRDRVLRRTPFSEGNLQDDQVVRDVGLDNGRRFWARAARASSSYGSTNPVTSPSRNRSSIPSSVNENLDAQTDDPQSRQRSNRVLGENRATFMERRRRIRSQVRALQRLGSRFENLSEHDRSCVLTGQHRIGHCTCPTNRRGADSSDDISTRASISRIVMLAEALFEVLDEIHQRSMVLSSPPSVSSIGSLPAPKEDVECLPLKTHKKPRKYQEDAQCYICLLEYEEGDFLRILPCQHEFHQACVDKWLKEIHRVCPLCRGDICRSNSSKME